MNIVLLGTGRGHNDGWSRYTDTLRLAYEQRGHTVTVVTPTQKPLRLITNPLATLRAALHTRKTIRSLQPDIIHVCIEPFALSLLLLSKKTLRHTLLTVHGSYAVRMFQSCWVRIMWIRILKQLGLIIAVSEYTRMRLLEEMQKYLPACDAPNVTQKIHILHNHIQLPRLSEQQKTHGLPVSILCVGDVKPRKGTVESLHGIASYRKTSSKPIIFTIVGTANDEKYKSLIDVTIEELQLQGCIEWAGVLNDEQLEEQYKKADVYLMPAKTTVDTFEGFGIVYLEAASYGIPCIGTNDSGAVEAINEGISGYKIDPNNPEAIASALQKIIDQGNISPDNCRKWAEEFDVDLLPKKLEALLQLLH